MKVAFVAMVLLGFGTARGDLLQDFRREYPDAVHRLEEAYQHVRIVTTATQTNKNGEFRLSDRGEFLRDGDLVRAVITITKSNDPRVTAGFVRAFGGGPRKFFDIHRASDQEQFTFQAFGPESTADFANKMRLNCKVLFATNCVDAVEIEKFFESPYVKLMSARRTKLDGADVVEIVARQEAVMGIPSFRVTYYFLPESWALAGRMSPVVTVKSQPSKPHINRELRVKYAESDPLKLRSIETWESWPDTPQVRRNGGKCIVQSIEFGSIPAEKFTLASLGVAEPGTGQRSAQWWWFILASSIACAVLGVFFAVVAHRKRVQSHCDKATSVTEKA